MDEPRFLAFETSGRVGRIGLGVGGHSVAERSLDERRRHARDLMPLCRELMQAQNWKPAELHGVIVSLGPGSYTGLRVGVMAAKAMCYALDCRLIGVPTFDVLARQADVSRSHLDVIADALKEKLYVQRFVRESRNGRWTSETALAIVSVSHWLSALADDVAVTGPGLNAVADRLPSHAEIPVEAQRVPRLPALLALGHERSQFADRSAMFSLEPIYLRPSSAEEQWANVSNRP